MIGEATGIRIITLLFRWRNKSHKRAGRAVSSPAKRLDRLARRHHANVLGFRGDYRLLSVCGHDSNMPPEVWFVAWELWWSIGDDTSARCWTGASSAQMTRVEAWQRQRQGCANDSQPCDLIGRTSCMRGHEADMTRQTRPNPLSGQKEKWLAECNTCD